MLVWFSSFPPHYSKVVHLERAIRFPRSAGRASPTVGPIAHEKCPSVAEAYRGSGRIGCRRKARDPLLSDKIEELAVILHAKNPSIEPLFESLPRSGRPMVFEIEIVVAPRVTLAWRR